MPEPAAGTCWCRVFPGRETELRSDAASPEALPEPDDDALAAEAAKLDAVLRRVRPPADLWPGLTVGQVTPDPAEVG